MVRNNLEVTPKWGSSKAPIFFFTDARQLVHTITFDTLKSANHGIFTGNSFAIKLIEVENATMIYRFFSWTPSLKSHHRSEEELLFIEMKISI